MSRMLSCCVVGTSLLLCGCRLGGSTSLDEVADALRAENATLKKQVESANRENAELRTKLAGTPDATRPMDAEALAALPRCTHLELDSLSGVDPRHHALMLYLRTLDGRHRFVQIVGTMRVTLNSGERVLRELSLNPAHVRDTYRSNALGTCYQMSLENIDAEALRNVRVRVAFADALTGATLEIGGGFDDAGRIVVDH